MKINSTKAYSFIRNIFTKESRSYYHPTRRVARDWVYVVPAALIIAAAVFAIAWGIFISFRDEVNPATVFLADGTTDECEDGDWVGEGFGSNNKFDCDGTIYTIQFVEKVERP